MRLFTGWWRVKRAGRPTRFPSADEPAPMNIHILRACMGRVPTAPREPRSAKRFPIATLIASMSLLVGVAGCGDERTGHAESGHQKSGSASGTPSPRASSDSASKGGTPDPRALGIDKVQWPEDRNRAKAFFDETPARLAGMPVKRPNLGGGPYAGVSYGPWENGHRRLGHGH
jgi:hypothetical protein